MTSRGRGTNQGGGWNSPGFLISPHPAFPQPQTSPTPLFSSSGSPARPQQPPTKPRRSPARPPASRFFPELFPGISGTKLKSKHLKDHSGPHVNNVLDDKPFTFSKSVWKQEKMKSVWKQKNTKSVKKQEKTKNVWQLEKTKSV